MIRPAPRQGSPNEFTTSCHNSPQNCPSSSRFRPFPRRDTPSQVTRRFSGRGTTSSGSCVTLDARASPNSTSRRLHPSSSATCLRPTVRPRCCSTATTTSCLPATSPCGTRHPSRRRCAKEHCYGRGAGDTKSNIVAVIGALRAWDGRPPVGMKFVFEGLEEVGSGGFVDLRARPPRALRRGRHGHRRHGQSATGVAHSHGCTAWHGERDRLRADARLRQAQRPVRWCGA